MDTTHEANKNKAVITVDENMLRNHVAEIVRQNLEETLNGLLDAEADELCNARKYERNSDRANTRAGYYERSLQMTSGKVHLKVPKQRNISFETAIIERCRRSEISVEESLVQMYLAGVSVRRIENISEALWGSRVSPSTITDLNQRIYAQIEEWRNRPLHSAYPYVFVDGV